MEKLIACFGIQGKQIISLIGSGGKTSLMWYLADYFRQESVLVSTTTKICYPKQSLYDYFYNKDFSQIGMDGQGITVAGICIEGISKLSAPPETIQQAFSRFDKIFLEADGSKQLPLKGWESFEPVVLPKTTITIGILPISALERTIDHSNIHRLPIFLDLVKANQGDKIQEETLAEIISNPNGLWAKSCGKKILCINQVETQNQLRQAKKVVELLTPELLDCLTKIIACSVHLEKGEVLWEK